MAGKSHKRCPKCCTVKSVTLFGTRSDRPNQPRTYCNDCNAALRRERPKEVKAAERRRHKQRRNSDWRKWYRKNRDRRRITGAIWRSNNSERIRGYRLKDKLSGKQSDRVRRRYALQRNAVRGCQKRVARIYKRCQELRQWFNVEVDHIIPLSFGGAHSASNLQIIYSDENRRKARNPFYVPRIVFK